MINLKTEKWEINNIETILFDKDGTFVDLHYFWGRMTEMRAMEVIKHFYLNDVFFAEICLDLGFDIKTKKMLADGITALYSRSKIIEIFVKDLKKYHVNTTFQEIEFLFDLVSTKFYKEFYIYTKPIDDAISFIKKVRSNGIKTGIVTSDSVESTKLTLDYYKWNDLFDVVIGRESSSYTKESGEPTKIALKELNANAKTTVMIGDAPMDYLSAKNAGIESTILVSTGQINEKELKKISKFTVDSLAKIIFTAF